MRTLRFLTLPTILGSMAAYLTCVLLLFGPHLFRVGSMRPAEVILNEPKVMLLMGGAVIVVPTYVLVILPLSIWVLWSRVVNVRLYGGALLLAGVVVTLLFPAEGAGKILFFLPFVPYAAVVAWAARRFRPLDCSVGA